MNAGQFLNGLAGTVAQAAAPVISTTWFPPGERTTATAIGSLCATLGMAVSFILGPNVVKISEQQVRLSSNFTSNRRYVLFFNRFVSGVCPKLIQKTMLHIGNKVKPPQSQEHFVDSLRHGQFSRF